MSASNPAHCAPGQHLPPVHPPREAIKKGVAPVMRSVDTTHRPYPQSPPLGGRMGQMQQKGSGQHCHRSLPTVPVCTLRLSHGGRTARPTAGTSCGGWRCHGLRRPATVDVPIIPETRCVAALMLRHRRPLIGPVHCHSSVSSETRNTVNILSIFSGLFVSVFQCVLVKRHSFTKECESRIFHIPPCRPLYFIPS